MRMERETLRRESDGREEKHDDWKKVHRRRSHNQQHNEEYTHVTSFYVSNLPERVTKLNIRKSLEPFGKIVDIYIGGKRDRSGSIFAFVRFANVRDRKALEVAMERERTHPHPQTTPCPPPPPPKTYMHKPHYGQKSYVDTVACKKNDEEAPNKKKIVVEVKPARAWSGWGGCILSGEVLNAQLISTIPMLLKLDGNVSGRIYYVGGLKMLIKFIKEKDAEAFLADDSNWNRWFSWLKKGFSEESEFKRITWINIWGVPTRFRSDINYSRIANPFGKVIETYRTWDAINVSTGHVCILTKSIKMINEEVTIKYNDVSYKVGVVDFDRDWSPFDAMEGEHHWFKHPEQEELEGDDETNSENSEDSNDPLEDQENNEEDDDGVSDTVVVPNTQTLIQEDTLEEGEIVEETPVETVKVVFPAIISPTITPVTDIHADEVMEEVASVPAINNTPIHEVSVVTTDLNNNCIVGVPAIQAQIPSGPLPTPTVPLPGESHNKRRRVLNPIQTNQFDDLQRTLDFENWPPLLNTSTTLARRIPQIIPCLDLNRAASSIGHSTTEAHEEDDSTSNEFSSMLHVGQAVGFQVTREDPVIMELVGSGGNNVVQ
ncbi:hypothetical protein LXL04_006768 [Taraxacum kok-saghyz]